MSHRLLRRLVLPLVLVAASLLGTSGVAAAAAPTGPVAAAPIHIFRCSQQGSYLGIWVNQRLTWCVANAGTLSLDIANVTPYMLSGNNAGEVRYYTSTGGGGSGTSVFGKYNTVRMTGYRIWRLTIY